MPDTNPVNEKKIEFLNRNPVSEVNTGKKKYTFTEISKNFKASFDCRDVIIKARKKAEFLT